MHARDHAAGGVFEQARDQRMYQGRPACPEQAQGKAPREKRMAKIGFIDAAGMMEENTCEDGMAPCVWFQPECPRSPVQLSQIGP